MKTATAYRSDRPVRFSSHRRRTGCRYPNEADRSERLAQLVDGLLAGATILGAFTILVFLLLL